MGRRRIAFAMALLALLVGFALAQAQTPAAPQANASIAFKFMAGTVAMPAGKYTLSLSSPDSITIREAGAGKAAAILPIITVLGRHDTDSFPELVFDTLPDGAHLSEVWFPGMDGYLVLATKGPHKHQVVQNK